MSLHASLLRAYRTLITNPETGKAYSPAQMFIGLAVTFGALGVGPAFAALAYATMPNG